eukprot:GFUD01020510.1.p1 GENE.GFUD01020510.1~~GFUD01020510.1.p1  ORF type:complete len:194 (+),score=21.83 GFUD01020510.1:155-736(+)
MEPFVSEAARISGILQMIAGAVIFFFGCLIYPINVGIRISLVFLISGALSIHSSRNGNHYIIIGILILHIFSAGFLLNNSVFLINTDYPSYIILELKGIAGITATSLAYTSTILLYLIFHLCSKTKLKMQMGQSTEDDLPRYEDVIKLENGNEQIVSPAIQLDQLVAGLQNSGADDLPRYEDVVGVEERNERI